MTDVMKVMADALEDVLIDAENDAYITIDTYEKVKYALDTYNKYWIEQTIYSEDGYMEDC